MSKKVLLIGGGGTLGTYVAKELLEQGHFVDVICLDDKVSNHERLGFYKGQADFEFLEEYLKNKKYDGIINFIHYPDVEEYPAIHHLLMSNTEHLIVLSSYRVYADEKHPVVEDAPMLLDVSRDKKFLETEKYAISKAKLERYLRSECKNENWKIVRPVISFSKYRFDLLTHSGPYLLKKVEKGEIIPMPKEAKDLTAGLDWAGNSGKLIAHLLFKKEAIGEAFTVSSGQNLTWGEIAEIYTKLMGANFQWVSLEEYKQATNNFNYYALIYDRMFDRTIDNQKILKVTGLTKDSFASIEEGLKIEFDRLKTEG